MERWFSKRLSHRSGRNVGFSTVRASRQEFSVWAIVFLLFEVNEELIIYYISLDGAWSAGKPACSMWSRGKAGDNFKGLPIANNSLVRNSAAIAYKGH